MDKKIIIGGVLFTLIIIGGGIIYSNGSKSATLGKTQGAKIQTFESNFDFKNIAYSGGNVEHAYKVKNAGEKDLTIANMATSCMCTKVFLKTSKEEGPQFGMKGMSGTSSWIGILKPGEEGQVVAVFDPTAHGPAGVGPVSRMVSLETNDPDHPYVEFSFTGTVVK